jgi:hypothetical protein
MSVGLAVYLAPANCFNCFHHYYNVAKVSVWREGVRILLGKVSGTKYYNLEDMVPARRPVTRWSCGNIQRQQLPKPATIGLILLDLCGATSVLATWEHRTLPPQTARPPCGCMVRSASQAPLLSRILHRLKPREVN